MNARLLQRSAESVRRAFPGARPAAGLVLGSGWREAADGVRVRGQLPYRAIPALGRTTVPGHAGVLLWGDLAGVETFVFVGRRHWYEGAGWDPVACPIDLLRRFGARGVLLANAAGGLNPALKPGALMVLEDHLNALGAQPLAGPHDPAWGARFPDQTRVYDAELRHRLRAAARRLKIPLACGVYLAVSGPAYETPAEVRAYRRWGADAVGMSTVPEAMLAHAAGLRVAALSLIANRAAGLAGRPLDHAKVTATAHAAAPRMRRLLEAFWPALRP